MTEIVFIVGLPASGKTTLARCMDGQHFEDAAQLPLNVEGSFILESPEFCSQKLLTGARVQALLQYPHHDQRVIYFENNPEQCLINAKMRPNKPVDGAIRRWSKEYNPPENAFKVFSKKGVDESIAPT